MDKRIWIIANWKSNKTISEALEWLNQVGPKLQKRENIQVIVCPTFSCLPELKKEIQTHAYPIFLGSQDLSPFDKGAYTGEEPAELLKELVNFSIVGHSERREKFGETDEIVAEKVKQTSSSGIESIFCIQGVKTPIPADVKIAAYEPVFAIGTGTPDTPENAQKVALEINSKNPEVNVLYGGSVTSVNCASFVQQQNIKGLLIGKASLDPEEFLKIIENCAKV
ncbi:triosephosphate isomerase [Candidatus Daviesbacteria bacterium]|nr:triosephosphate isomerase [Candidatus Daviesbacteria bacterium]